MNKAALEFGMKAALALNCEISKDTHFDRKNYFYPDNPKAYQISQFDQPIGHDGWIEIEVEGKKKKIRIERVHLEEDAGKNMHGIGGYSYVDLNRQGTPLIEIVSEADMRSPEEAYAYLEALRSIIQFTEVSDVKMEEGSMRCDANISLRPYGQEEFGTKAELKNLNSLSFVKKGLAFEEKRQAKVLLSGGEIQQETRRFDETLENGADAKQASNWLMGEVSAYLNSEKLELAETKLTPENLAGMIRLIADGTISSKIAKKVFRELITNGGEAQEVVEKNGWVQLSDPNKLLPIINEILDNNQQSVDDFKNGKDRAVGFLVGQIMKATKGQANPGVVNKLLKDELAKR